MNRELPETGAANAEGKDIQGAPRQQALHQLTAGKKCGIGLVAWIQPFVESEPKAMVKANRQRRRNGQQSIDHLIGIRARVVVTTDLQPRCRQLVADQLAAVPQRLPLTGGCCGLTPNNEAMRSTGWSKN